MNKKTVHIISNPDIPDSLKDFTVAGDLDHAVYTHRGYKDNLYTIAKDGDGWFWSYDRGDNLVDKESGFSSPEDAFQDLNTGKGKYVANIVLDEEWWASRQNADQR